MPMLLSFSSWRRLFLLAAVAVFLAACGKSDPKTALDAAVQRLQDSLEAKKTSDVMDLLHPDFQAGEGMDRAWAQRTMALMFMRYANIRILAVSRDSRIDSGTAQVGHTEAKVLVTGAQGLIPERAEPYAVRLQWRLEGSEWKLLELQWE